VSRHNCDKDAAVVAQFLAAFQLIRLSPDDADSE
jgi:hypothetical protein